MTARPAALDEFLRDIGPRWEQDVPGNVKKVIARYGPLLAAADKSGTRVHLDRAYGDDPRQQLDVFQPETGATGAVVVFVHGGAFTDGDRNRSPEVYSNVLYYLARHGVVGVNIEYRQAPTHKYPAGTEDVAAAFNWVCRNIHHYGGDPRQVFVMGHSAGATHAGTLVYDPAFAATLDQPARGLIVVSGRMRADNLAENPNARKVEAYYGTDSARMAELSPVSLVRSDCLPTFIAYAEYENPLIDLYCLELAYRIATLKRHAPHVMRLADHNHTSIIAHINTEEDVLGPEILRFIAKHAA